MPLLEIEHDGPVTWLWLNRPEVRNALNLELIDALLVALSQLTQRLALGTAPRVIVLAGSGPAFCAGGDIRWMQESVTYTPAENIATALRLGEVFAALDALPCAVLARVHGACFGGGLGLAACCDSVIAAADTNCAFSEVRLGIAAATIAPYVVAKVGVSAARDLLLSGERFSAEHACRIGLFHALVPPRELDGAIDAKLDELLAAGPRAAAATKELLRTLGPRVDANLAAQTARLIADLRASPEGQEGLRAFLDRRPASWQA